MIRLRAIELNNLFWNLGFAYFLDSKCTVIFYCKTLYVLLLESRDLHVS